MASLRHALIVAGAFLAVLLTTLPAMASPPTLREVEAALTCPTCKGKPLTESSKILAHVMDRNIRQEIAEGWSKTRIIDRYVQQLGPQVRLTPVTTVQWKAVLTDWLSHGTFSTPHSCAEAVVARTYAPPTYKEGTPLVHALDLYELSVCTKHGTPGAIKVGMSNPAVADVAGVPVPWRSGPHSWWYRKPGDGRSVIFNSSGYVIRIENAVHG